MGEGTLCKTGGYGRRGVRGQEREERRRGEREEEGEEGEEGRGNGNRVTRGKEKTSEESLDVVLLALYYLTHHTHLLRTHAPVLYCRNVLSDTYVCVFFFSNACPLQSHKRQIKERDGMVVSLSKQLCLKGITSPV